MKMFNQAIKQSSNQGLKKLKIVYQWALCAASVALIAGCGGDSSSNTQNEQAGSLSLSVASSLDLGGTTTANVTVNSAVAAIGAAGSTVDVTLADTSSCSPGLTIAPATQSIAIGSTGTFMVTATNALCVHQLKASTSSLSAETPITVTVVPLGASITVGLYDNAGLNPVTSIAQGGSIKLKFTGTGLTNVNVDQMYQAQTTADVITLGNSGQCSLSSTQTSCDITVTAKNNAMLVTGATITLTSEGNTTVVPLSQNTLPYDVTAQGALSALNLNNQPLNLLMLYYGSSSPVLLNTQTVVVKNTGAGDLSNILPSGTDLTISNNTCAGTLLANGTCQFDVALSSVQTFGTIKNLVITANNAAGDVTIPVLVGVGLAQTGQTPTSPINPAPAGSDGALQKGIAWPDPRFVAGMQADGTTACPKNQEVIVDKLTGLMWPKNGIIGFEKTDGGGPIAQPDYTKTTANLNQIQWEEALTAVSKMNTVNLCGYSDWRLPNVLELETLINQSQPTSVDWLNHATQGFSDMQSNDYWSSSTVANYTGSAWIVNFNGGSVFANVKTNSNYVLPVRGPN
jgi:hypothetical protein